MKINFFLPVLIVLFVIFSCDKEDTAFDESENLEAIELRGDGILVEDDTPPPPPSDPPKILGALVEENTLTGISVCSLYSLYAVSTKRVNYSRDVSLAIVATVDNVRSIVDANTVRIPANENTSNNINPILSNLSIDLNNRNVSIVVTTVLKTSTREIDNNYIPLMQKPTVMNCVYDFDPNNFNRFLPVLGDNDFDNDGRENDEDTDDDNDGIPDDIDTDDDNDGINDGQDKDDDNDGLPDTVDNN